MPIKKAMVTLAVGADFVREFERQALAGWRAYADRHGYDLFVLTEPLDPTYDSGRKSVHWQKLLVGMLSQLAAYDYLVWVDTDVLINHRQAPCIVSQVATDKIGVVWSEDYLTAAESYSERFGTFGIKLTYEGTGQGRAYGIIKPPPVPEKRCARCHQIIRTTREINTGVFVFQPAKHNPFLASCYGTSSRNSSDGSFEQSAFSQMLREADMAEFIDEKFNRVWSAYAAIHYPFLFDKEFLETRHDVAVMCVNTYYHNNYFCHFAGTKGHVLSKQLMDHVDQNARHLLQVLDPEIWDKRDEVYAAHNFT